MSRKQFTEEQLTILRQNPYVYSVTGTRMTLTKEFKEIFMTAYQAGELPRTILEDHGFDISIIGERRIWSISQHIRDEYKKYGEFHEGYGPRNPDVQPSANPDQPLSEKDELKQLRHEVDYLKQEIDFLKKISSIRTTRK
jgi:hypothetical protein